MSANFYQNGPELANQYRADAMLQNYLKAQLPTEIFQQVEPDLDRFGQRVVSDLLQMAEKAEREPPVHIPFDPWGRRIDEIKTSEAWDELGHVAAEEGIVAIGYERKFGAYSRLVQFAKLYLYHPSSAVFSCPLAMTDGAARAIELYGDVDLKKRAFANLTSRDPKKAWTSGQWMTERTGGSDVSGTSTIAKHISGDKYELHGTKWFTSATTSQMAMTLARIEGHPEGNKGLSLFYLELRDAAGNLQNIEVHRLKDKLGTKALPTAELSLKGTPAKLVGGEGNGVRKISALFNITRMYNAICALGATRRVLALAFDYSNKRVAFGKKLIDQPLHAETLADLQVEFEGNFMLTFHLVHLLGKDETGEATAEESAMLRLLTPIAKLYTAKSCMAITSEVVEIFGGAGYIEDTGIPKWHRDAQVFSIWEGATNVLSLDVIRAIEKENAFAPFLQGILKRTAAINWDVIAPEAAQVNAACKELEAFLTLAAKGGSEYIQAASRQFSYSLARTCAASLLLEKAQGSKLARDAVSAQRWCANGLASFLRADLEHREKTKLLLK